MSNTGMAHATTPAWEIDSQVPGALRTAADVWTYRHLMWFLARRSLQRIYRRTVLGWLWLFIIPLFPIALRTLVFGGLLGVTSDGIPYFFFLLVGTIAWDLFAIAVMWGTRALELHGDIQDVYVPRVIMPVAAMAAAYLDLGIKMGVLLLVAAYFQLRDGQWYIVIGAPLLMAAAALVLAWLLALGIALFTSVWCEERKDVRYALGQLIGIWFLLTPVLYPMSLVPESWRVWVLLNPMAGIVNGFKYGLLGVGEPHLAAFGVSALIVLAVLGAGIRYFASRDAATIDAR